MNKEEIMTIFYDKEKSEIWHKFKEIESSIEYSNEVYNYFDDLKIMLLDDKSYIKMRGFRIICKLAKWDKDDKIEDIIHDLLNVLDDEKGTIVRMCLDSLSNLLLYKPNLSGIIETKLNNLDLSRYKDTLRPLIEKDINYVINHLY